MLLRSLTIATAGLSLALAAATSALAYSAETTDNVNVRTGPGVGYSVLFALPAGSPVNVGGCQPSWCWIDTGGGTGWVSAAFISDTWDGGPPPHYRPYRPDYPYRPYRPYYDPPGFTFGFSYGPRW